MSSDEPVTKQPAGLGDPPGSTPVNGVTIRRLQDTEQDAEFAAKLQIEAFRNQLIYNIGLNNLDVLQKNLNVFYRGQKAEFYGQILVAEHQGAPVGMAQIKYNGDKWNEPSDHISEMGCRPMCRLVCFDVQMSQSIPANKCYLEILCVESTQRGLGIGKLLMDRTEYEARARNCTHLFLAVMSSNRAKGLYERHGLQHLFLAVMSSNRAKGLYERHGLQVVDEKSGCCCCLRCYTGERSYYLMEKRLT